MQCYLCIVAVSGRVCRGKKEAKKVKRKEERRIIVIGTEERKSRNYDGEVKVYYFILVTKKCDPKYPYFLLEQSIVCRGLVDRCVRNFTTVQFFECCIQL
jgi:hypothetical protein